MARAWLDLRTDIRRTVAQNCEPRAARCEALLR